MFQKTFDYHLVLANNPTPIKIDSGGRFGVTYQVEGEKPGTRVFHASVYVAKKNGTVEIKTREKDQGMTVELLAVDGNVELEPEKVKLYREADVLKPMTGMEKVTAAAKFAGFAVAMTTGIVGMIV